MNNNTLSLCDEGTRLALFTPYGWKVTDSRDKPFSADIGCFLFFFFFYFLQQTGLLPDTKERNGPSTGLHQPSCPCLRKENWDLLRPRSTTNVFLQISNFFSREDFQLKKIITLGGWEGVRGGGPLATSLLQIWKEKRIAHQEDYCQLYYPVTKPGTLSSKQKVVWLQGRSGCSRPCSALI